MKMGYDTYLRMTNNTQRCQLETAEAIVNQLIKEYEEDESDDTALMQIYELAKLVTEQEKVMGTSDNFHNFAVAYAKIDALDIACKIIEKGLEKHSESVDLLADYIKYGNSAGEYEKCKKYYEKLKRIPKGAWNWRAFSFTIDYMIEYLNVDGTAEKEIAGLADMFKKILPQMEEAYISRATVYKSFNDSDNEKKELEGAIKLLDRAPRCALRLADIYFDKGDYENALIMAKKCQDESPDTQPGTSFGYPYLLSMLCRISLYYRNVDSDKSERQEEVEAVYKDYHIAKRLLSESSLLKNLKSQIEIFEKRTGTEADEY